MSTERERMLARRWGLVTPSLVALCVFRFLRTCVEDVTDMPLRIAPHTLAVRMSQLKPAAWKSPAIFVYGGIAGALVFGAALVMIAIGVRDALRSGPDE